MESIPFGVDSEGHCLQQKFLHVAVTAACLEAGFTSAEKPALNTLTGLLQNYLRDVGRSCKSYCELSGRTQAVGSDIMMTMARMGLDAESLISFPGRPNRIVLPTPVSQRKTVSTSFQV